MKIDTKFLKRYIKKSVKEIIRELQEMGKTRSGAYDIIYECVCHEEAKRLDSNRGEGDSLYFAERILGAKFWFLLIEQVVRGIVLDAKAGHLSEYHEKWLKDSFERVRNTIEHPEKFAEKGGLSHWFRKKRNPNHYR